MLLLSSSPIVSPARSPSPTSDPAPQTPATCAVDKAPDTTSSCRAHCALPCCLARAIRRHLTPPPLVASHVRHGGRKKLTVPQKSRRGTPSSMVRRSSRSVMAAQWGTGKMPGGGVKTERSCSPHATSARCRACHGAASHLTLHPPPPITALCTHSRQMLLAHAEAEQPDRFRQRVKALAREHSLP